MFLISYKLKLYLPKLKPIQGRSQNHCAPPSLQGHLIACGEHYVESASVYDSDQDCFAHSAGCDIEDFVYFVAPTDLEAVARSVWDGPRWTCVL